tara:strand:+ start:359 stop:703 length:345 start_codon:yes stop_codon:yes gene_type:complete
MNASNANLLNSICLIGMGLWGYFELSAPTAFIPVGFGVVLLACQNGVKKENKVVAHIAVLLTLLILVALCGMTLPKKIESGGTGLLRVLSMVVTSALSMVLFIKSFIDARKNKS